MIHLISPILFHSTLPTLLPSLAQSQEGKRVHNLPHPFVPIKESPLGRNKLEKRMNGKLVQGVFNCG
jgi:hypothetical protein